MKRKRIDLKIEHGIPVPARGANQAGPWAEALSVMDPGDSFLVDTTKSRSAVLRYAQKHGLKVVTSKINGIGYRVWKIGNQDEHSR